ncbi:MAG TPA: (E)-4-hydroxy-3-methylbut-2-enyl-diphosphate synthase [Candidatus Polarisedimenticolia bacterium]|nr:(E)-4-hydroxy-3-methylbut-2-enyl-diphosphate synthase [Candidatus Polarisedimenticolia bacterium]
MPWSYRRRVTREVGIGEVRVGGRQPIRIQSMTTPATHDVEATVAQIRRLAEAGCEIVRVTVPSTRDAEALPRIRRRLAEDRIRVPLVADIHFSPAAAMMAVEHVEKVRINPGNYADTKRFKVREYSDAEYGAELRRIEERFAPLVLRARQLGVSLRIGTNHGSLSDRILNRYGDTPLGMVESALEFVRICEKLEHRELILSMKSSNPMVMIQAYRLLAERMADEKMDYPFHLGVTEAGDGEDGRIKSAIGIGALLEDGIGDTLRVSLTEDPVAEVPVARALAEKYNVRMPLQGNPTSPEPAGAPHPVSSTYMRREAARVEIGSTVIGGTETIRVECLLSSPLADAEAVEAEIGSLMNPPGLPEARVELLEIDLARLNDLPAVERAARRLQDPLSPALSIRIDARLAEELAGEASGPLMGLADRVTVRLQASSPGTGAWLGVLAATARNRKTALGLEMAEVRDPLRDGSRLAELARICEEAGVTPIVSLSTVPEISPIKPYRMLAESLAASGIAAPILLSDDASGRRDEPLLFHATAWGSLLCDGIGDALRVERFKSPVDSLRLAFNILQGARLRLFKTEFISCPSCGRTQFDLEETTSRIKSRTAHLKGVKIAIMGCIVNGPGEMADADFGYVGWGPGKVSLFVGKDLVEKDIPYLLADERLVQLIRERGMWTDPPAEGSEDRLALRKGGSQPV